MNAEVPEATGETPPAQFAAGGTEAEGVRSEVGYIPAIEGLRGTAVLWVVVFHYVVLRSGDFADLLVLWIDASPAARIIVRGGFAFPCYFGTILVLSTLSFRYVELPFMRQRRCGIPSAAPALPGAPIGRGAR